MARAYGDAGKLIDDAEKHRKSLKSVAFGGKRSDSPGARKAFALASETIRFRSLLEQLLDQADVRDAIFGGDGIRDQSTAFVMLYDLLFGKGSILGGGKLKRQVMQGHDALVAALGSIKAEKGLAPEASAEELLPHRARRFVFPRYARVNLVKLSVEEALERLRADGLSPKVDKAVPTLLILPRGTELHEHPLTLEGGLVLQDKSSCFSAQALLGNGEASAGASDDSTQPSWVWPGGDVIDACAAPGNKTTHLMSLLHAHGSGERGRPDRVFAFDKDARRLKVLRQRADAAGGSELIVSRVQDFLKVDTGDPLYMRVRGILLDPSCSGSGIVTAAERSHDAAPGAGDDEQEGDEPAEASERVKALAAFQLSALLKAFSFPQVEAVVYSTCSVHTEENELVVARALAAQLGGDLAGSSGNGNLAGDRVGKSDSKKRKRTKKDSGGSADGDSSGSTIGLFELVRCLPGWPRRGKPAPGMLTAKQSKCLARADPFSGDETNGFFVAKFVRRQPQAAVAMQVDAGSAFGSDDGSDEEAEVADEEGGNGAGPPSRKQPRGTEQARKKRYARKKVKKKLKKLAKRAAATQAAMAAP